MNRYALGLGILALASGCTGDDPPLTQPVVDAGSSSPSTPNDGGGGGGDDGGDGSTSSSGGPPAPLAVDLFDADPTDGAVAGNVIVTPAADESGIDGYALYFGDEKGTRASTAPLAVIAKGAGAALKKHVLPLGTKLPLGADHILAVSVKGAAESSAFAKQRIVDRISKFAILPVPFTALLGFFAEPAAERLLLATVNSNVTSLSTCKLDGTGCTSKTLGGEPTPLQWSRSHAAFDPSTKKILITGRDGNNPANYAAGVLRCADDGTGCVYHLVSTGDNSGNDPFVLLSSNPTTSGFYVLRSSSAHKAAVSKCAVDATGCAGGELVPAQPADTGRYITGVLDTVNSKLLAIGTALSGNALGLYRCELNGSGCTFKDLSTAVSVDLKRPTPFVDTIDKKLLVVTSNTFGKASLTSCGLDGLGCVVTDLAPNRKASSGTSIGAAFDEKNRRIYVGALDTSGTTDTNVLLLRCTVDGATCDDITVSGGVANAYGPIHVALDSVNDRVYVVGSTGNLTTNVTLFTYTAKK